ncbi:MAG: TolC family protein [Clostridium sp.]
MKYNRKILSLLTVTTLTVTVAATMPMQVMAANPDFAHDEATWAKLRDNVMEYDELQMLVEEYNPSYMNNQVAFKDNKSEDDAETIRQDILDNADSMSSQAEDYRDRADGLLTIADSLQAVSKDTADTILKQARINSVPSLMSAYSAMISGAAMMENAANKQQMSADSSYLDNEMRRIQYLKNQTGLIVSAESLFNSYNQLNNSLGVIQKNIEILEAVYASTQTRASIGLATQADVLSAKKNIQSLQSTFTQSQSSLASVKQKLCMMTGWKYDAQPEIRSVPTADVNRIALMNPAADQQAALDHNYDLKYNKRQYSNMNDGTSDKKNMERTIKNMEENIVAGIKNLYNDVLQKQTACELADAELTTETTKMNAMENKNQLGMVSRLEYLQEQAAFLGKQIDRQTADIALFQSIETYDWAVKGYMNLQ